MRLGLEAGRTTVDLALEHGVTGVPVSAEDLVTAGVQATVAPLRERGLQVCQIGAFGYNPLSNDRSRQAKQAAILEKAIPLAAEAGCPYIVVCGGNYHPSGFAAGDARNLRPEALDEAARTLRPMVELAERHGVRICIEPYLKTVVSTPERFLDLQKKVGSDALRCNVDVTSLYAYWDLWYPTAPVEHICKTLVGHYGLVHIKDVALAEGFHIHVGLVPLGHGVTDWSQVLRLVAPYVPADSWIILEHVQTAQEARDSLAYLRDAAARAGVMLT